MPQLDAVIIRNLTYDVGRGSGKRTILNRINLTVPEGSIYGLLGPSGCGKTTMLRCVVGRIRARSGSVLVFGLRPSDSLSEVPGRDVGYMPQEISIYEDFTIEETLIYFGRINRMNSSEIAKRIEFLLQFLDLPSKKRLVANLSGGQKRRVSLAAALVHSPPLLILDEPTVGVDPLLRQSIWQHLVTLTQTERISVIITTHYIEEARQANVVGLMRHGKILAEDSPDELMRVHERENLEDVFLKLCVTDSSRRAAALAEVTSPSAAIISATAADDRTGYGIRWNSLSRRAQQDSSFTTAESKRQVTTTTGESKTSIYDAADYRSSSTHRKTGDAPVAQSGTSRVRIKRASGYSNQIIENFSSEDDNNTSTDIDTTSEISTNGSSIVNGGAGGTSPTKSNELVKQVADQTNYRQLIERAARADLRQSPDDYLAMQSMKWASRRSMLMNSSSYATSRSRLEAAGGSRRRDELHDGSSDSRLLQWWKTLMAVTWKNYVRLRRNPPVLVFQFMLPAIQVILFCLCIGGEPFDVPVAIVNDELVPRSSRRFLDGLNKRIIRQVRYDNLTSAMEAVRRGTVWGAIHIPDKYSQNLQSRLIMGEEVTKDTISNGTIRVYPDLTNLHLALALETTFRETFINFARDSLEELGYDRSLADLPIQIGKPVYGTMNKDGYLEFMAPGVVISISYVMATGLTALAFILERRDGLLERSLVSGVQTGQILLAHAINQVVVMMIQIFLVLGCTFFIFEIPSRGPFPWVVLLILLQGCTGMGFGLLVSAICKEENTAVMMVVGTFYTNLILAGIIWPIEAMPHWLRPLSYAQPQTLPTDTLRHILSRGWGILEPAVLLGFVVTIGWLVIFLMSAGLIFKYSRN